MGLYGCLIQVLKYLISLDLPLLLPIATHAAAFVSFVDSLSQQIDLLRQTTHVGLNCRIA